jgi:AraC-like DNA-binding protein
MPDNRNPMPDRPNRAEPSGGTPAGTPIAWPEADPLEGALHLLRMSSAIYCECTVAAPWGIVLPALPGSLMFHVVRSGTAWLDVAGQMHELRTGAVALLPHGLGHRLVSRPDGSAVDLERLERQNLGPRYEVLRIAGAGPVTSTMCGTARIEHPSADHLVRLLPPVLVSHTNDGLDAQWMEGTLAMLAGDARSSRPAIEGLLSRVADVIVLQAMRAWLATSSGGTGWLGALVDPQIGRALAAIHRDVATAWTLASLAREVGMSRSAFAARFAALVGEPAMRYVVRWKMQLAADALARDALTMADVAERVGYESEAAFSRAFKRVHGIPPGLARRRRVRMDRGDAA